MKKLSLIVSLLLAISLPVFAQQKTVLFDAAHAQTAGNADWTLDEDVCGTAQRYPTPDQAGITSSTAETYWSGAFSAMGVDLVKKGFHVESLPVGARISYNDSTNPQDLKNYNVFVIPEPNIAFTSAEITAIRSFVQGGGGLFMIADHAGADRNNDGIDAAGVFNQLMGSPSIFGITYNDNSSDKTYGWFDNHPDDNYTTDGTSPIIYAGAFGVPQAGRGLGLFGSTSMTISGNAKGHVWMTTVTAGSTSGVTFATSTYGSGRVAAVGDSSTGEDATNGCGHTTYLGYNDPSYDNGLIYANAVAWLAAGSSSDTQPPTVSITSPANGATLTGTVSVAASASDNVGVTKVEFYLDGALQSTATASPYSWSWNTTTATNASHTLTAKAYDAAGNVGTSSAVSVTVSNSSGDTTPPTTSITAPANGATVSGTVSVTASASDNVGVTKVEFYLDGALQVTDTASPYTWSWNTTTASNASHALVTKAYDAAGNVGTSATVTVTVSNTTGGGLTNGTFETGTTSGWTTTGTAAVNTASKHSGTYGLQLGSTSPSTDSTAVQTFTLPSNATQLSFWYSNTCPDTVTYDWASATIKDNSTGTTTTLLANTCTTTASWTQVTWNAAASAGHSVTLTLANHDDNYAGDATYTYYDDVVVTTGTVDTTPPTTSITAPAGGATVSGTVSVTASASDNVGVTKVEFYLDGALKTTDTASPYSWSWDTTAVANGSHSLVSKAYDAAGNVGTSATVTVTVSNTITTTQLLGNPGFENGSTNTAPWTTTSGVVDNSTGEPAHSGSWKAWMCGYGSTHTDTVMQQVAIPSGKTSATLTFWLHIDTAETTTTSAYDTLQVQIRNSSGTVLATLATYSNLNAASGYVQKSFNVSSYIGQTIQVYLVGSEDSANQTSFVVDDFALNVQ